MRILVKSYTTVTIMSDKSQIPQFTGADYTGWAFTVKYGLADKKLHRVVMDWDSLLRRCRPIVILPLTPENELQFTGADYTEWAFKVKYGLADKKLHRVVMDWDSLLRRCRPDVIFPLTPDNELQLTARGIDVDVERSTREQQISQQPPQLEKWDDENLAAMSYIVKHLGPSELTHITNCTTAAGMWEALKTFYMV